MNSNNREPYMRRRKSPQMQTEEKLPAAEQPKERKCPPKDPTPLMLINEISKLFCNHMRKHDDPALNNSYRHILFHLAHRDGRTQLELAKLTHLKPPTVSVSLAKLEADGYVERTADPDDLRQTRVYLTEKGQEVDRRARIAIDEIESKVTECLCEAERTELISLLIKLRDNLTGEHITEHETI